MPLASKKPPKASIPDADERWKLFHLMFVACFANDKRIKCGCGTKYTDGEFCPRCMAYVHQEVLEGMLEKDINAEVRRLYKQWESIHGTA